MVMENPNALGVARGDARYVQLPSGLTNGDILIYSNGTFIRLAVGSSGKFIRSDGTTLSWAVVADSDVSFTDITTGDVGTSKHGYVPKAPNDTTKFLRGDATWAAPAGAADTAADAALRYLAFG